MEQACFLQHFLEQRLAVNIYLRNGIKLYGYLAGFDQYTVLLKTTMEDKKTQAVYKHAISTICCVTQPE